MELRPCTAGDLAAVVEIERRCTAFPWSEQLFLSSLATDIGSVLAREGLVLGFSLFSLVLDEACLLNIAVDPAHQGEGLGRHLLQQGLDRVKSLGAASCYLEVRESNEVARSLYRAFGFEVVGERPGYYPAANGREKALVMEVRWGLDRPGEYQSSEII